MEYPDLTKQDSAELQEYTSECTKGCLILKCSAIILFSSTRKETIAASPHNDLQL